MIKRLSGLNAIVTGGSQGIGKSISLALANEGANVQIFSRNIQNANIVVDQIKLNDGEATAYAVDVCQEDQVYGTINMLIKEFKKIDILVNCVGGFNRFLPVEEVTIPEWDLVMNVNLKSAFIVSKAVIQNMKFNRFGRIINIASIAGSAPNPYAVSYLPYGAAKAGLIGFTKHLAKELGAFEITVNAVSPGTTATERVLLARDANS